MDKVTRKDLKSDRFVLEVQHGVEYVSDHRQLLIRWGSIAGGVLILLFGYYLYSQHQHGVRQEKLAAALHLQNASVGPGGNELDPSFSSQAEKDKAVVKAFTEIAVQYPGTDEGIVAEYYLGTNSADEGKFPEAEKHFKEVVDSGKKEYAALAKMSLAQVYQSEGKLPEAQNLLKSLIDKPTVLVSKEEATVALAHVVAASNPQEARKLLEPLRANPSSPVSRAALTALSDIPAK